MRLSGLQAPYVRHRDRPSVLVIQGSIGKFCLFDGVRHGTYKIGCFRNADSVKRAGECLCRWCEGADWCSGLAKPFCAEVPQAVCA